MRHDSHYGREKVEKVEGAERRGARENFVAEKTEKPSENDRERDCRECRRD